MYECRLQLEPNTQPVIYNIPMVGVRYSELGNYVSGKKSTAITYDAFD